MEKTKKVLVGRVEDDINHANELIGIFTPGEQSDYLENALIPFIGKRVRITIETEE